MRDAAASAVRENELALGRKTIIERKKEDQERQLLEVQPTLSVNEDLFLEPHGSGTQGLLHHTLDWRAFTGLSPRSPEQIPEMTSLDQM